MGAACGTGSSRLTRSRLTARHALIGHLIILLWSSHSVGSAGGSTVGFRMLATRIGHRKGECDERAKGEFEWLVHMEV